MPELTIPFCLREIASNMEQYGNLYIRIGLCVLDYDGVSNCYVVLHKDNTKTKHVDLIAAINDFMSAVAYAL